MLFNSKENQCLYVVLKMLKGKEQTYGAMFKKTKVSHTTLQKVLSYLSDKKFIYKSEKGYEIIDDGSDLLDLLMDLRDFLKE